MSGLDPILLRGLAAIEPYLDEVVIAGGWVPHIYELLYDATKAGRSPRTRDIDLAVRRDVPVKDMSMNKLLESAGFTCRFQSLETPPVTKYVAKEDDDQEIEIEFITDAPGSSEGVRYVQPDVTAQELHYVVLLLENTWPVDLGPLTDGKFEGTLLVPTPGAFVLHKALVFKGRADAVKKEKDLYYVFFVVATLPDWREVISGELGQLAQHRTAWFKKCVGDLKAIFDGPDGAGVTALLNQRPGTAYPGLSKDQFRQYAFGVMSELIAMMDEALALAGK